MLCFGSVTTNSPASQISPPGKYLALWLLNAPLYSPASLQLTVSVSFSLSCRLPSVQSAVSSEIASINLKDRKAPPVQKQSQSSESRSQTTILIKDLTFVFFMS